MTSAVDWLMSKLNFARNSKFHIRMTILYQLRDSVTLAMKTLELREKSLKNKLVYLKHYL